MKKNIFLFTLFFLAVPLSFGGGAVSAKDADPLRPLWLRYPAISPDGKNIVFSYQSQIWVVPAKGGDAWPLTSSSEPAYNPIWSPDSSQIAFCSLRHGNRDVFIVNLAGGPVKRLTYHSTDDVPMAFSRDGKMVYFSSARLGNPQVDGKDSLRGFGPIIKQVYAVPVAGGRPHLALPTTALEMQWDKAGKRFLYSDRPSPLENIWRKHERSDAATNIWLYDIKSKKHQQITTWNGEDRSPVWGKDGKSLFWLNERSGSFNVWQRSLTGGKEKQITFHSRWPVRFLTSADNGTLAYAFDGEIWIKNPGEKPQKVNITLRQRSMVGGQQYIDVTSQSDEMVLSPTGREMAIVARGEVFVINLKNGKTRRITHTPAMERYVDFAPDGRSLLYASERNKKWEIFTARLTNPQDTSFSGASPFTEKKLVSMPHDAFSPKYAPSGESFAYVYDRDSVRVYSLKDNSDFEVMSANAAFSYEDGDMEFCWSPDSHWLAIKTGMEKDIELFEVGGSKSRYNISRSGFSSLSPKISKKGQMVLWLSDMYGLRTTDSKFALSDVKAALLSFTAMKTFYHPKEHPDENSESEVTKIEDIENLNLRTFRLTPFSREFLFFDLSPDSEILMTIAPGSANSCDVVLRRAKNGEVVESFRIAGNRESRYCIDWQRDALYSMIDGELFRYNLHNGDETPIYFRAELLRDVRLEAEAIFEHNWRETAETFYNAKMHGVDWNAVGNHYRAFLPHINDWINLSEILDEMIGELNASHQWAEFYHFFPEQDQTASLGVYYDETWRGPGVKIADILIGGPASYPNSPLVPGAVILAIDNQKITPQTNIYALLNHKAGKKVLLTIKPPKSAKNSKDVTTTVKPMTLWLENHFAYMRWLKKRRELVTRLSDGHLGYVHVKSMNGESYQQTICDIFGLYPDVDGLIVDIRHNNGGNLHKELLSILAGKRYAQLISRKGYTVEEEPSHRFGRPSVVVTNASSYSDGSVFPLLYKQEKLGLLVGENVPGTGTAVTHSKQLHPNLSYTIPKLGFAHMDGTFFENDEVKADVLVYNDPNSLTAGKDMQLEKAVEVLMKIVNKEKKKAEKK